MMALVLRVSTTAMVSAVMLPLFLSRSANIGTAPAFTTLETDAKICWRSDDDLIFRFSVRKPNPAFKSSEC